MSANSLNKPTFNLMITCLEGEYTQEYIANVFWNLHIAKVSNITLIPFINKQSEICNIAYIKVNQWCESEAAYNFIRRLNAPDKEARIVHREYKWWPVQINTHNNGDISVGTYTVQFDSAYFERETYDNDDYDCITETPTEFEDNIYESYMEKYPIKGLYNKQYTVEEALQRLSELDVTLGLMDDERPDSYDYRELCNEISQLNNELCIHKALNNTSNVSQRVNRKVDDEYSQRLEEAYFSHPMYDNYKDVNTFTSSLSVRSNA